MRVVVRDKTPVASNAVCCPQLLVHVLLGPWAGQVSVLKCTLFACLTRERVAYAVGAGETSTIGWYTHDNLVPWHTLTYHVRGGRVTGYRCFRAVWDVRREQLCLVTTFTYPWPRVVIRHEVDHVQILCCMPQGDVLKSPFARRKC